MIDRCGVVPPFGAPQRLAETANAAATVHQRGLVADLFGYDLQAAAVAVAGPDKDAARCQAAILRRAERLAQAWIGDYARGAWSRPRRPPPISRRASVR